MRPHVHLMDNPLIMWRLLHLELSQRFKSGSVRLTRPLASLAIWSPFTSAINDFLTVAALVVTTCNHPRSGPAIIAISDPNYLILSGTSDPN